MHGQNLHSSCPQNLLNSWFDAKRAYANEARARVAKLRAGRQTLWSVIIAGGENLHCTREHHSNTNKQQQRQSFDTLRLTRV
jgi:hypothetical protein